MSTLFQTTGHFSLSKLILRCIIFFIVLITAFTGPWWISFGLAAIFIFFTRSYELLLGGLILDTIFAQEAFSLPIGDFVFTSLLLTITSISWILSRHVQGIRVV